MIPKIALRASNGQYVCAEDGGGRELVANRNAIGDWEKFSLIKIDGARIALQTCNGKYLCAEGGGGREVLANRNVPAEWETFTVEDVGAGQVALKACNGQYFCAEGGGGREIVANRKVVGLWERFELSIHPRDKVALQAFNGQYLCAEGGGGREVLANRNVPAEWETFTVEDVGAGQVALKAHNGQYLCAEGGGGREIVANRGVAGPWERFSVENLGWGRLALKAANGQYLCAEGGGGLEVVANRNVALAWETFRIVGYSVTYIVGGRVLYSVQNESDHVVCVKPEGPPTAIRIAPHGRYEGPIDGLKIPGQSSRMLKVINNCDATVYNDRVVVDCSKLNLQSIGKKFDINLPNYDVPSSADINEVIQKIVGGWMDVAPDDGWKALEGCTVSAPPDVDGSNRRVASENRAMDRERFENMDRNQYDIWEREDKEWIDRTA